MCTCRWITRRWGQHACAGQSMDVCTCIPCRSCTILIPPYINMPHAHPCTHAHTSCSHACTHAHIRPNTSISLTCVRVASARVNTVVGTAEDVDLAAWMQLSGRRRRKRAADEKMENHTRISPHAHDTRDPCRRRIHTCTCAACMRT